MDDLREKKQWETDYAKVVHRDYSRYATLGLLSLHIPDHFDFVGSQDAEPPISSSGPPGIAMTDGIADSNMEDHLALAAAQEERSFVEPAVVTLQNIVVLALGPGVHNLLRFNHAQLEKVEPNQAAHNHQSKEEDNIGIHGVDSYLN
jgi:hypothetical protein